MFNVANGWDGLWSSVCGGLIGGVTVFCGLWLAWEHEKKNRQNEELQRAVDARRQAANELVVVIHNTRDAAVSSNRASTGGFSLWPLRKQLILSETTLNGLTAFNEAMVFYDNVSAYRNWARENASNPNEQ